MDKDTLIEVVAKSLKDLYSQYSSQGLLSCYIWGSILTSDFRLETSDIDTIAIVDDRIDPQFEEKIQKFFTEKHPEIRKFGFRIIYKSEFDTGGARGILGMIGDPALLLLDLPTWHWVCGTKFVQKDFALPIPSFDEAIRLRYKSTMKRWPDIDLITSKDMEYFVKQVLRIIHLQQLKREHLPYTIFSYSSVKEGALTKPEEELVKICLQIKSSKWSFGEFEKHKDIFKKFVSNM